MKRRFDIGEIKFTELTNEGFLKANAIVTRTGILLYQNADGSIRRELRHPDDVFEKASLDSLAMIPITNEHPSEGFVDADNAKSLQVGTTGQEITPDGKYVKSSLIINDSNAVQSVQQGKRELSLGYSLDLITESGVYDGENYDARQTNIRYNHLALVSQARAGSNARIALDSAVQTVETTPQNQEKINMDKKLIIINLDGLEYQASPEIKKALDKLVTENADSVIVIEKGVKDLSELQAKFDTQSETLKKAENIDVAKLIAEGIASKVALVAIATPHLNADTLGKVSELSEKEIKLAVISANTETNMDGKDESYIQSRFDSYVEAGVKKADSSDESNTDGIADQRSKMNADGKDKGEKKLNADDARKEMIENQSKAWEK